MKSNEAESFNGLYRLMLARSPLGQYALLLDDIHVYNKALADKYEKQIAEGHDVYDALTEAIDWAVQRALVAAADAGLLRKKFASVVASDELSDRDKIAELEESYLAQRENEHECAGSSHDEGVIFKSTPENED